MYLVHWPVPLNPNGNHPSFPTIADGTRDIDYSWSIVDTWKQMEEMVKKGMFLFMSSGSSVMLTLLVCVGR